MREELRVVGKMVLLRTCIVTPQNLKQQVLAIAHEGHVEIVDTKLRLRTKVSINQSINQLYLNTVNCSASWFSDMPCDNYNL